MSNRSIEANPKVLYHQRRIDLAELKLEMAYKRRQVLFSRITKMDNPRSGVTMDQLGDRVARSNRRIDLLEEQIGYHSRSLHNEIHKKKEWTYNGE